MAVDSSCASHTCFLLLVAILNAFFIRRHICDYLNATPFQCSLCRGGKKYAAMWFGLSFTLLLARTPPEDVRYPTAASHNRKGSNVNTAICLTVCHFWPSGYLWFPRSSPGPYVTQRAVNFSTMRGRGGRLEDVRKMFDDHISIRPDRRALRYIPQLPLCL